MKIQNTIYDEMLYRNSEIVRVLLLAVEFILKEKKYRYNR